MMESPLPFKGRGLGEGAAALASAPLNFGYSLRISPACGEESSLPPSPQTR